MRVEPSSRRRMGEQRRYFPDWTARLLERSAEIEADRNSYLAGGYAEEFGYRAQPGYSRGVPVLDGEAAEESIEWQRQARVTHPGYPIRPRPLQIDIERIGRRDAWNALRDIERWKDAPGGAEYLGTFVCVSDRTYARRHRDASARAAAVSMRLAAALFALRWKLGRGRSPRPTFDSRRPP